MTIPLGVIICWSLLMAFFVISAALLAALRIHEHHRGDQR